MNRFNFRIDWNRFINDFIPPLKRRQRLKDLLAALLSQVKLINLQFADLVSELRYNMQFDGTVISLETLLNETFGTNGIFITDGMHVKRTYIFTGEENQDGHVFTEGEYSNDASLEQVYLYTEAEMHSAYSFIVNVSGTLTFDENRMRALLDKYRAAGKLYTIVKY